MKGILRWPLIVAAAVVILRVIAERAGAPHFVSAGLSIAALTTALAPAYFGLQIAFAGKPRPFLMLFKLIFVFAVCARTMVLPTYWAARIFEWEEPRFAGVNSPNAFIGFVALPFITAAFWVVASMIVGGLVGSGVLAAARSKMKTA